MKLLTWNCAMGLEEKYQKIRQLSADVMVIQECSQRFTEETNREGECSSTWFGTNPKKGMGVFVKPPWFIRKAETLSPKWTGRVEIDGPTSFELFPVWAYKEKGSAEDYIGQIHLLLDIIEPALFSPFAIVAGDFSSHTRWDKDYGVKNHSLAVERFRKLGFESAYHKFYQHCLGPEEHPTHWHLKKKAATYHIDYVFLSRGFLSGLKAVAVGSCDEWLPISDHAPILVELES